MRYVKKRNRVAPGDSGHEDDPLSGVANLFDLSLVFIVAVLMALFAAFGDKGELEIITKKNNEIKVQKVTSNKISGNGTRLGMAYKLQDGRVVYVEDSTAINIKNK